MSNSVLLRSAGAARSTFALAASVAQSIGGESLPPAQQPLAKPAKTRTDRLVGDVYSAAAKGVVEDILHLDESTIAGREDERAAELKQPVVCGAHRTIR